MTTREYFQTVLDAHISDEMDAASVTLIENLDKRNAKRKATPTKDQREAAIRREAVREFLMDHEGEQFTRDAIAAAVHVTPAQVTAACRALGDFVSKSEVKVDKVRRVVYSVTE